MQDHSGIQCPACKEWLKEKATVCKYSHTALAEFYSKHKESDNR